MRNNYEFRRAVSELQFILGIGAQVHTLGAVRHMNNNLRIVGLSGYQVDRCIAYNQMFHRLAYGALGMQRMKKMNDQEYELFCGHYGDALDSGLDKRVSHYMAFSAIEDNEGLLLTMESTSRIVDIDIEVFRRMRHKIMRKTILTYVDDTDPLDPNIRLIQST